MLRAVERRPHPAATQTGDPGAMLDRHISTFALILIASLALLTADAFAQRFDGQQGRFNQPSRFGDDRQKPGRNVAGQFDYYALVMSWSPTYCASADRVGADPQCDRHDGRRFAFVLHGLWPQYEKGYPEYCPTRGRPFVPQPVIDDMLDIMPSPRLVIHEYKKHGTCSGLDPAGYYTLSRRLFGAIQIPERYRNPIENMSVSPDELADDFIKANPDIKPDMMAISCGGPGNRLREIRVCFSKQGGLRTCGRNEDQRRLCSASKMFVPPVRSTRLDTEPPKRRDDNKGAPLPGPRPDGLPRPR
ncbi:MAG: ribonuclease T [Hyphomicrobium sp.]|nr:MAG: ribonuclease T [Hyphomicrobium sp.]